MIPEITISLNVKLGYPPQPKGHNEPDLYAVTSSGTIRRFYSTFNRRWKEIATGEDLSEWVGYVTGYFYATDFNLNQKENHEP